MKIWVDDIRHAPNETWDFCATVNGAIELIQWYENHGVNIELIDLGHDAGDYVQSGGTILTF